MSKKFTTAINIPQIKKIFREYCKKNKTEFSSENFNKFLDFLEIDFYDWIKENLKQFEIQ